MKSRIIQTGKSKGLLIPRTLLEKCGLKGKVELEAQPGQWVVRPAGGPRRGWTAAFKKMAQYGDDRLLDDGGPVNQWSRKDWKW